MGISIKSTDFDYNFDITIPNMATEENEVLKPSLMLGGSILGTVLGMCCVYLLWKH